MISKVLSIALALIPLLPLSAPASADQTGRLGVGSVAKVQNLANAVYADTTRLLAKNSEIKMKDLLRTAVDSRLKLQLRDGSNVVMGEHAELMVDDFIYTPDKERTIILNSLKGALLFVGKKMQGFAQQDIRVKTPVADLGVRGTHFWIGPIAGDTGVLVLDGAVLVRSKSGFVSLGPGEGTMIKPDGSLSPAKLWGKAKKAKALKMVEFD